MTERCDPRFAPARGPGEHWLLCTGKPWIYVYDRAFLLCWPCYIALARAEMRANANLWRKP